MKENDDLLRYRKTATLLGRIAGQLDTSRLACSVILQGELEGRPFDLTSLAAALSKPRPTIHRLTSELVASGQVEISLDQSDRRRSLLHLTRKGRHSVSAYLGDIERILSNAVAGDLAKGFFVKLKKCEEITRDAIVPPIIKRIADWSTGDTGDIPADFLNEIFVIAPDFSKFSQSAFSHWGGGLRSGRKDFTKYSQVNQFISEESIDLMAMFEETYRQGSERPVLHKIQVEWDGAGTTYQRILVPHPRLGIIGCSRWLD